MLQPGILFRGWNNTSLSLSTDGSINTLNANLTNFAKLTRYAWFTALAGKYVTERGYIYSIITGYSH